jgi:mannose-1-phosphate guanylyltransferase / mannose-6-phosphate isomerase
MYALILCGGSGSRLWPLSRNNYPKQFLSLGLNDTSLLQQTFTRLAWVIPHDRIFFVTHGDQYWHVFNQIREVYPAVAARQIVTEPARRNTAAALTLGIAHAQKVHPGISDTDICVVAPSDHHIDHADEFINVLRQALNGTSDRVAIIGTMPTKPSTGFGYFRRNSKRHDGSYTVDRFHEKPNIETATAYVASNDWVWNTGIYLLSRATLERELALHAPHLLALTTTDDVAATYAALPDLAIDHAVSEKTESLVAYDGSALGWSDIGSFDAVDHRSADTPVEHIGIDSTNVRVFGTNEHLIATIGIDDVTVVKSRDSTLICKNGDSEKVKHLVEELKARHHKTIEDELLVHRPWGMYEVLVDSPLYKVKRITVLPGAKLSLQSHKHRSEHWVVVKGSASIVNGSRSYIIHKNESVFIPKNGLHQLGNAGNEPLEIIEVQTGQYLGEDDITRYADDYQRETIEQPAQISYAQ